jgi:hypothetical protein
VSSSAIQALLGGIKKIGIHWKLSSYSGKYKAPQNSFQYLEFVEPRFVKVCSLYMSCYCSWLVYIPAIFLGDMDWP